MLMHGPYPSSLVILWDWMPTCPFSTVTFRIPRIPYNYRNATAGCAGIPAGAELEVFRTAPRVVTTCNAPFFKTRKLLGGRALIGDTFRKPRNAPAETPGGGSRIHGSGYTVLYGDMHAVWRPDEEGRIAFWPPSNDWNINLTCSGYTGAHFGADDPRTLLSAKMALEVWRL